MLSRIRCSPSRTRVNTRFPCLHPCTPVVALRLSSSVTGITEKYKEKLEAKVREAGVSDVSELAKKVKTQQPKPTPLTFPKYSESEDATRPISTTSSTKKARKDSSPVKPLNELMDLDRINATHHTADQISTLWTTYHSTRTRGFLSATLPLATYQSMISQAQKYPTFILPLPRKQQGSEDMAHEFYFLEWSFYDAPQLPSPFESPSPNNTTPQYSTILFTPLAEYKLRQSFAQPQMIITNYTDLSQSHGIVLLRGELTPSASIPGKFLLSQEDAQLLAFGIQRFYLGVGGTDECTAALQRFHEKPEAFKWEKLIELMNPTSI